MILFTSATFNACLQVVLSSIRHVSKHLTFANYFRKNQPAFVIWCHLTICLTAIAPFVVQPLTPDPMWWCHWPPSFNSVVPCTSWGFRLWVHGYACTATTPKQINWLRDSWVPGWCWRRRSGRLFGIASYWRIFEYIYIIHSYNDMIMTYIL